MAGAVHAVPVLGIQLDEGSGQRRILLACFVGDARLGAHHVEAPPCCIRDLHKALSALSVRQGLH